MEYEIILKDGTDLDVLIGELKTDVEAFLREGWKLQGGISITSNGDMTKFIIAQTLTK